MFSLSWFQGRVHETLPEVAVSDQQFSTLFAHFELLIRWNERMDLTSVETANEIVARHYCESMFFSQKLPVDGSARTLLDFGSGAGFPGFPIAVLHPEWPVTLLESNQRRVVFLKEATRDLPNVTVVAERGEQYSQQHDWVVARAVRARDVLGCVPRLAGKVGLLVSDAITPEVRKVKHCVWSAPVPIPWSESRCCLFGECST